MTDYWMKDMTRIDWVRDRVSFSDKILEVGCDTNDVWKDTPFRVTTLDINSAVHPDVVGDAEALPFENREFDIVCVNEVLEHVKNPRKAIKEALRVAQKKVIATVPWEQVWDKQNKPFDHPDHIRYYDPKSYEAFIKGFGRLYQFDIINFGGYKWLGAELLVPTER